MMEYESLEMKNTAKEFLRIAVFMWEGLVERIWTLFGLSPFFSKDKAHRSNHWASTVFLTWGNTAIVPHTSLAMELRAIKTLKSLAMVLPNLSSLLKSLARVLKWDLAHFNSHDPFGDL